MQGKCAATLTKIRSVDIFSTYFELGIRHIADVDAYDHMLFLLVLIAVYQLTDLKQILILVTAFTVGHSLSLILAATGVVKVDVALVEFLIPVTIFIAAVTNLIRARRPSSMFWSYLLALVFGLVHGLGFSNYLLTLLSGSESVLVPMLAFNLGIEVGQIGIVVVILLVSVIAFQLFRFKHRDWILVLSGAAAGVALVMLKDAAFWQ